MDKTISIFGLGPVGLITGVCLASKGFKVMGFDKDPNRLQLVSKAEIDFYEPKLEEYLRKVLDEGLLNCTDDYKQAVKSSQITFVAVGTPSGKSGDVDLTHITEVSKMIGEVLKDKTDRHLVVVRSTIPPSTTENVIIPAIEKSSGKHYPEDFGVCVNPEFLREGNAIEDFLNPDKLVVGAEDDQSRKVILEIYDWCKVPKTLTNFRTAEMIKYANNVFLAARISLANELGNICKALGIDWFSVAEAIGSDKRIGPYFLKAGLGFGGSCLPKDTRALVALAKRLDLNPKILQATLDVNQEQPTRAIALAEKHLGNLKSKKIGILGLSFKPDTDDIREARSIIIIKELLTKGASIYAHDPKALENMRKIFPNITYVDDPQKLIDMSDAIIIATEWSQYEYLNYQNKIVIDGRRLKKAEKEAKIYEGLCW